MCQQMAIATIYFNINVLQTNIHEATGLRFCNRAKNIAGHTGRPVKPLHWINRSQYLQTQY